MDHNLEDSLNMESIENMDFDHSGVVVNQEDIVLEDSGQPGDMPMDMETIEEEPQTMLGAGNEEVIVSDFIGDQFGYQEYTIHGENTSGANITIDATQLEAISSQNEQMTGVQYGCTSKANTSQPNVITLKAAPQQRANKKAVPLYSYARRQVAIAPKPAKVAPNVQYAIAPKPVTLVVNKSNMSKVSGTKNIVQGIKGNTVLAQIGKQLVMMPAGAAGQKIKLSSILPSGLSDSNVQILRCGTESAQLIANKGPTPLRTKLIVQGSGQEVSNQPAVITKLMPVATSAGGVTPRARYVMQQKTVPISIGGNKVVLTTPPKQAVTAPKKQIISIKAKSSKVVTSQANVQTKKVVITANQTLKPSSQVAVKDSNAQGQRTQLHSINVPGKGIQFIKLVTNQSAVAKAAPTKTVAVSGKNFVLTDSKGNIIQMSAEKLISGQPPPLIVTSSASTGSGSKVLPTMNKLVRIAPISHRGVNPSEKVREVTKMAYCVQPKQPRASQSLLMPRDASKSVINTTSVSLEEFNEMVDQNNINNYTDEVVDEDADLEDTEQRMASVDVKPNLASLLSSAANDEENLHDISNIEEVEIEYENTPRKQERYVEEENSNSMEQRRSAERTESLIIVPSDDPVNPKLEREETYQDDTEHNRQMETSVDIEPEGNPYLSPSMDQNYSDSMFMYDGKAEPPGMRPRKACNCTKSQCLKLYCDCFANGEFCNNCNCNNCHNNLDNEERRQKAIRACLERNPNAFRPKIGKAKSGGPEIVRRHNKGCHCKRSGCLKNYCECYEAKIACTLMCKCFGCRNVEDTIDRRRDALRVRERMADPAYRTPLPMGQVKQPCSFMTMQVIEAVAQCMIASVTQGADTADPVEDVLLEFSRCMADIISASHCSL